MSNKFGSERRTKAQHVIARRKILLYLESEIKRQEDVPYKGAFLDLISKIDKGEFDYRPMYGY